MHSSFEPLGLRFRNQRSQCNVSVPQSSLFLSPHTGQSRQAQQVPRQKTSQQPKWSGATWFGESWFFHRPSFTCMATPSGTACVPRSTRFAVEGCCLTREVVGMPWQQSLTLQRSLQLAHHPTAPSARTPQRAGWEFLFANCPEPQNRHFWQIVKRVPSEACEALVPGAVADDPTNDPELHPNFGAQNFALCCRTVQWVTVIHPNCTLGLLWGQFCVSQRQTGIHTCQSQRCRCRLLHGQNGQFVVRPDEDL